MNALTEILYEQYPDRLYFDDRMEVWYAFYDNELTILSNATGTLESFTYGNKPEYREVRSVIVDTYPIRQVDYATDEMEYD